MNFSEFKSKFLKTPVIEHPNKVGSKPKVSVCVPTHNHQPYITECLESILNQKTDFDFEILIGDDDSTDGTKEICLAFAEKFPDKIRFFRHRRQNNIRIDKTFTGIFNALYSLYCANGKYIAYCDGDDYWGDENKLQHQVNFLDQNPDYVLTFHEVKYTGRDHKRTIKLKDSQRDLGSEDLKRVIVQPLLLTICFKNVIKDFPKEITEIINSDNFLTSLLGHYGKGKYLSYIKPSFYRLHEDGIWSMQAKEIQLKFKMETYKVIFKFYKSKRNKQLSSFFKLRSKNYTKMLIYYNLTHFQVLKALKNLLSLARMNWR
ncbi:glycosyltransferase [Gramella sp. MAR_2010_147]|uniref:glycosyltransferase family 2 protein n=1 Tax=Gramella sp. MAR_2010_147 TaxID=1250205 RepID=UPI00087A9F4A|nr:glycosyltransferase [Gramella sp. MAR_2010_147]SDR70056.1 Glycosyltransferase involved in cell wall bisynthesis [Gramella sp. MAR_2010_147]